MKKKRIEAIEKELQRVNDKQQITEIIINFIGTDGKVDSTMIIPINDN